VAALVAMVVENLAPLGLDNLVVPLFIGLLLSNL
jgi:dolichol kinase